jgi:hypothetical protein
MLHHWAPFRHPRVDFAPATEVCAAPGEWSAARSLRKLDIAPGADG